VFFWAETLFREIANHVPRERIPCSEGVEERL